GTGEKFSFVAPNRPNTALDPFMRHMLREVAAGCGVSYEALSRDYSQSNYSSSRLALIDDRDTWRVLQRWFIDSFRELIHQRWLQQAVLARAIDGITVAAYAQDPQRFAAVKYKPRGWSWVDPTKEVAAFKEAEKAGYITKTQIIAQTAVGQDFEDVMEERRQELDSIAEMGLEFDTDSPDVANTADPVKPEEDPEKEEESGEQTMRMIK
ncbi:MAG: phage portal protein, partial [Chloroflexi bacterium]|nr:phage portal protein [Chloroflexota bacterium]